MLRKVLDGAIRALSYLLQWAPTLGGECYFYILWDRIVPEDKVSMGTHPWG